MEPLNEIRRGVQNLALDVELKRTKTKADDALAASWKASKELKFHKMIDELKTCFNANWRIYEIGNEKDVLKKVNEGFKVHQSKYLFVVDEEDWESFESGLPVNSFIIHGCVAGELAAEMLRERINQKEEVIERLKEFSDSFKVKISSILSANKQDSTLQALSNLMNEFFSILRPVGVQQNWSEDENEVIFSVTNKDVRKKFLRFYVKTVALIVADILKDDIEFYGIVTVQIQKMVTSLQDSY